MNRRGFIVLLLAAPVALVTGCKKQPTIYNPDNLVLPPKKVTAIYVDGKLVWERYREAYFAHAEE